jgi:hypothetical protein
MSGLPEEIEWSTLKSAASIGASSGPSLEVARPASDVDVLINDIELCSLLDPMQV